MSLKTRSLLLIVGILLPFSASASASALAHNGHSRLSNERTMRARTIELEPGDWKKFTWNGDDGAKGPTFEFTSQTAVVFTVTDAYCPGDRFTLTDGGHSLGVTTVPARTTCHYHDSTGRPDKALTDPAYTHGMFALSSGAHAVAIVASTSPFGGGGAWVRVDALTKSMCKSGGWTAFGGATHQFRNQGQCVALVARSQD
jgi:hypothetical protein